MEKNLHSAQPLNSIAYWNDRFSGGSWEYFDGEGQSAFFAHLALKTLPAGLKEELAQNSYTIRDVGCALGAGTACLAAAFPACTVEGIDFSSAAVEKARQLHPECRFEVGDILALTETKDVIFCSNTLEHLAEPARAFDRLGRAAEKYLIVLVPYRDKSDLAEHVTHFQKSDIPLCAGGLLLSTVSELDCSSMGDPHWIGYQLLLVYARQDACPARLTLANAFDAYCSEQQAELNELREHGLSLDEQLRQLQSDFFRQKEALVAARKDAVACRSSEKELLAQLHSITEQYESTIRLPILETVNDALESKPFKMAYLLHRFRRQGMSPDARERKAFRAWMHKKLTHRSVPVDQVYNPFYLIRSLLSRRLDQEDLSLAVDAALPTLSTLTERQKKILAAPSGKCDILMLGVIDYDFRFQRPQHFARRFAQNGHRVFYINANFHRSAGVTQKSERLYVVDLHFDAFNAIYDGDFSDNMAAAEQALNLLLAEYCIRDAVVVADYPNWVFAAGYLHRQFGFRVVTDYMDDYTGFLTTAGPQLANNCRGLLKGCDAVVASSQFLHDIAVQYNSHCEIVRNGTEFEHFCTARQDKAPGQKKVIGYYGAVSHWFDCEKVCAAAERFSDCDIQIVGAVTDWTAELKKHSNIRLIGEKSYQELPAYLAQFDVCLIPFDTTTDLIRATNPVKFYEYLSAGKKIVATEIPELEEFRGRYVLMSNNTDVFCDCIRRCLDGTDGLAPEDERIAFGRENDWQQRYEAFERAVLKAVPKVSVIIITYNNMAYSQACLESVLQRTGYANYEVILVDNLSSDGTRDWLTGLKAQGDSRLKILLNDKNLGFAGGNNVGIKAADGDYVLLLNNDTLVTRGWMTNLVKHLENNPRLGMTGSVTNSIGNEAMVAASYTSQCTLEHFAFVYTTRHMNQTLPADVLAMFCTLIRREVLDKCGSLDERYAVGMFEDDDYAEAVKKAGYQLAIAEDSFIHHFHGLSFAKRPDLEKIMKENQRRYEKKWGRAWKMQHYRPGVNAETNQNVRIVLDNEFKNGPLHM